MADNITQARKHIFIGSGAPTTGDKLVKDDSTHPLRSVYIDEVTSIQYIRTGVAKVAGDWVAAEGGEPGGSGYLSSINIFEDFPGSKYPPDSGTLGTHGWAIYTFGGGTVLGVTGAGFPPTVIRLLSPSGGYATTLLSTTENGIMYGLLPNVDIVIRAKLESLFGVDDIDNSLLIGLNDGTPFPFDPTLVGSIVGFSFSGSDSPANWFATTRNSMSAGGQRTDTGVAADTDWHTFRILSNSDATSVNFYIDGVLVATNTIDIPTDQSLYCVLGIGNTTELVDRNLLIDYYSFVITGLDR